MSAYTKALRLLGETERMIASERKRDIETSAWHSPGEAHSIRANIARLEQRASVLREVLHGEAN